MKKKRYAADVVFLCAAISVWVIWMVVMHGDFRYYGRPLPSVITSADVNQNFSRQTLLEANLNELYRGLAEERRPGERAHILHNLGTAYYEIYRATRQGSWLDSTLHYYEKSIALLPDVDRFNYNLGRIYTEKRDQRTARSFYEKAIAINPRHILALHNLAILSFFDLRDPEHAQIHFEKALQIEPRLPISNLVLGMIREAQGAHAAARDHYLMELRNAREIGTGSSIQVPVSRPTLQLTMTRALFRLAVHYSYHERDLQRAQEHLDAFCAIEGGTEARAAIIDTLRPVWKNRLTIPAPGQ